MTKSILLGAFLMTFAVIGMGVSSAQAHCGKGCGIEKAQTKPCEKCMQAGKTCKCASKKPCEKTLGKKKPCEKYMKDGKPCKCPKTGKKKPCEKTLGRKGSTSSAVTDHTHKGSLTINSNGYKTGGTASYND